MAGPGDGHVEHPSLLLDVSRQPMGHQTGRGAEHGYTVPFLALDPVHGRQGDTAGGRFWLFREGLYLAGAAMPRWYLHGLFG